MLNVGTVQSFATLNDKGFESGIKNLKKKGERFSKDMQQNFDKIGRSLTSIGSKMTATISAPLLGAGALAVKTAADYETLRTSMDILNGSVEEGARNFERLKEFSAATPFQLGDLAKAQNMLQGFGMEADNAFNSIKMIGDIAAVSGGSIEGIGIAFGQAAAEGKLMTRDIRQLINQGVPAIKLLADTMGVAQSEVFSLAEQGEISFDILNKAFQEATSEGGMFADGMAKQAKTIRGVFSTLKDNVSLALGELGQTIVEELDLKRVIGDLIESIQSGVKWFSSLSSEAKKFAVIGAGIATAIGPTILALGMMARAMSGIMIIMPKLIAGVKALTAAMIANPYIAVGAAIAVIATKALLAHKRVKDLNDAVDNALSGSFESATLEQLNKVIVEAQQRLKDIEKTNAFVGVSNESNESWVKLNAEIEALKQKRNDLAQTQTWGIKGAVKESIQATEAVERLTNSYKNFSLAVQQVNDNPLMPPAEVDRLFQARKEAEMLYMPLSKLMDVPLGEKMRQVGDETQKSGQAMMGLANSIGMMFEQAVLHGQKLDDVVKNLLKQLASRAFVSGIGMLLTGGVKEGSTFLKTLFGGMFHGGGIVKGSGDKMIRAKGGEMVLTKSQQKALSMGGGQQPQQSFSGFSIENKLYLNGRQLEVALEDTSYKRRR